MADAANAAQLLDIDVDQLSGVLPLVAARGFLRVQVLEAREAMTGQDARNGGRAQAHPTSDLRARVASASQAQHLLDSSRMNLPRHPARARAAIDQRRLAGLLESTLPLEGRPSRKTGRLGGAGHRHSSLYSANQEDSTGWATSGILVKLHLGSFGQLLALDTSSLTDLGPDGQLPPVNNVLRNEI
jgi:hypothetical protein